MPITTRLFATTSHDVARLDLRDDRVAAADVVLPAVGAQCVAVDPADPNRAIVGTFDEGVYVTRDGGETWEAVGDGLPHRRVLSVAVSPCWQANGRFVLYAGTEPSALYRSEDDGRTWHDAPGLAELPSAPTWSFPPRPWTHHVRWIAPHPTDPATVSVGIELGGVMTTRDGGATWEDRKPGAQADAHALATHPDEPDRLYEAAGGGVAVSDDAGATWRPADDGMDRHYAWAVAVDAADPNLWYVSTAFSPRQAHASDGHAEAVLYRKRRDAPWQALGGADSGLDRPLPSMPYALVAPRGRPNSLIAGMQNGDLALTDDAGETWRVDTTGLHHLLALAEAPA